MNRCLVAMVLLALTIPVVKAHAGEQVLYVEYTQGSETKGVRVTGEITPTTNRLWLSDTSARLEQPERKSTTYFDFKARTVRSHLGEDKFYTELPFEMVMGFDAGVSSAAPDPKSLEGSLKATGVKAKVGAYNAEEFAASLSDAEKNTRYSVWVSKDKALPTAAQLKPFEDKLRIFLRDSLQQTLGAPNMSLPGQRLRIEHETTSGSVTRKRSLVVVSEKLLDKAPAPAFFDVPKELEKRSLELPMLPQQGK